MNTLVLLVGSNPLPNYLTAMALKPQRVVLVYTSQTEEPMKRLRDVLRGKGLTLVEERPVKATEAKSIYDSLKAVFEESPGDMHLNYTGGTKTMAAHARMAFKDTNCPEGQASYLDERAAVIRFDDGRTPQQLGGVVEVDLETTLALHGSIPLVGSKPLRLGDAAVIARAVFAEPLSGNDDTLGPKLPGRLYGLHRKDNGNLLSANAAKKEPVPLAELRLSLSIDTYPAADWTKDEFKDWAEFFGGVWFEQWVASVVRDLIGKESVHCNVECTRSDREFELDIVVVRGHRLHVLSCTTDTTLKLCKSKLFEVAARAEQIGGELARSAVACLLHGQNNDGNFVDQLRGDVASLWDSPNAPRVFGFEDVKQWLGQPEDGVAADTSELSNWLTS